jgi:hypothetical protein
MDLIFVEKKGRAGDLKEVSDSENWKRGEPAASGKCFYICFDCVIQRQPPSIGALRWRNECSTRLSSLDYLTASQRIPSRRDVSATRIARHFSSHKKKRRRRRKGK